MTIESPEHESHDSVEDLLIKRTRIVSLQSVRDLSRGLHSEEKLINDALHHAEQKHDVSAYAYLEGVLLRVRQLLDRYDHLHDSASELNDSDIADFEWFHALFDRVNRALIVLEDRAERQPALGGNVTPDIAETLHAQVQDGFPKFLQAFLDDPWFAADGAELTARISTDPTNSLLQYWERADVYRKAVSMFRRMFWEIWQTALPIDKHLQSAHWWMRHILRRIPDRAFTITALRAGVMAEKK